MKWKLELSSMQNALEFLAQAAGTVAKEGAKEIIKEKSTTPKPLKSSLDATNKSATDEGLKRLSKSDSTNTLYENTADMLNHTLNTNRKTSQLMEEIGKVRPPPTRKIDDFDYIGPDSLLTKEEAIELIEAFFSHDAPILSQYPTSIA